MKEYDAETCWTAGQLREMGIRDLPTEIPDCAWVPKTAVRWDVRASTQKLDIEKQLQIINIPVHIDVDFKWLGVEVEETEEMQKITTTDYSAKVDTSVAPSRDGEPT